MLTNEEHFMSGLEKDFLIEKGITRVEPYHKVLIDKNDYIIKTADTLEELIKTFEIRYQVYGQHYTVKPPVSLDIDEYDKYADHIIVVHKETAEVLGTYRALLTDNVEHFYTERAFDLSEFKKTSGRIAEMGRATVVPNARSGAVINLLWRGIGDYIKTVEVDYLIGCATFWGNDPSDTLKAWHYFNFVDALLKIETSPHDSSKIDNWSGLANTDKPLDEEFKGIKKNLPPLVKSYIKAGAKFGFEPSRDHKLSSFDFFAACKLTNLPDNLVKKYL